jgi:arsenate reductase
MVVDNLLAGATAPHNLRGQAMTDLTLYHNPRCSKSRQALELLRQHGVEPTLLLYLNQPPSHDQLSALLDKLAITPRQLLRRGEAAYKDGGLADSSLSDAVLIAAMLAEPKLIERPIAVRGDRAVIGRPPERVLELLNA